MSPDVRRWLDSLHRRSQVWFLISTAPFSFAFTIISSITRGEKAKTCEAIWCRHQFSLRCQKYLLFLSFVPSFQIAKSCGSTRNLLWQKSPLHRGPLCTKDFASGPRQQQWGNNLGKFFFWHKYKHEHKHEYKHKHKHEHEHNCNQCGNKFEYQ